MLSSCTGTQLEVLLLFSAKLTVLLIRGKSKHHISIISASEMAFILLVILFFPFLWDILSVKCCQQNPPPLQFSLSYQYISVFSLTLQVCKDTSLYNLPPNSSQAVLMSLKGMFQGETGCFCLDKTSKEFIAKPKDVE